MLSLAIFYGQAIFSSLTLPLHDIINRDLMMNGVYIVWPDVSISAVVEPALPAPSIKDEVQFSPADSLRLGPNKYFVGRPTVA